MNFTIHEGSTDCPVIVHVPHASREIPAEVAADFIATDDQIARELDRVTDDHTDTLAAAAAEQSGCAPWMIIAAISTARSVLSAIRGSATEMGCSSGLLSTSSGQRKSL